MADSRYTPLKSGSSNNISVGSSNQSSTQDSSSSSNSFSGIANEEALASLLDFIKKSTGGGSESFKNQLAIRQQELENTRKLSGDYSKEAAFSDSAQLMAQQLQQSLEANMPAITKAIQGAGTSSNSMQGLLSQRLATDSAQAAGAAGAEQAKAYGNIQASLANTLEALSRINTEGDTNFLRALDLLKVATSSSVSSSTGRSQGSSNQYSGPAELQLSSQVGGDSAVQNNSYHPGPLVDPDAYQYIPYDLQNPGYVNPYSSYGDQQTANDFSGYSWE